MALTSVQQRDVVTYWIQRHFVAINIVANFNTEDLRAAVQAIDNAFDTTLSQAVAALGGALTVAQGLNAIIPAPFSTATAQQKTFLVCYVAMKRAGLL